MGSGCIYIVGTIEYVEMCALRSFSDKAVSNLAMGYGPHYCKCSSPSGSIMAP